MCTGTDILFVNFIYKIFWSLNLYPKEISKFFKYLVIMSTNNMPLSRESMRDEAGYMKFKV